MVISNLVYWLEKKYITLPRIGMINFGQQRQKRKRGLVMALVVIVGIQVSGDSIAICPVQLTLSYVCEFHPSWASILATLWL